MAFQSPPCQPGSEGIILEWRSTRTQPEDNLWDQRRSQRTLLKCSRPFSPAPERWRQERPQHGSGPCPGHEALVDSGFPGAKGQTGPG